MCDFSKNREKSCKRRENKATKNMLISLMHKNREKHPTQRNNKIDKKSSANKRYTGGHERYKFEQIDWKIRPG